VGVTARLPQAVPMCGTAQVTLTANVLRVAGSMAFSGTPW